MSAFLKNHYGDCEGPLGIPCLDCQARSLEDVLKRLPREQAYAPGHLVVARAMTELLPGARADISWISTENVDRLRDVVLASGMDDSHFQLNPVVTLQHAYWLPPVGRSVWRRVVEEKDQRGVKARTHYPARPSGWDEHTIWPPDFAFSLIQAGLLCGKSIGFLPTRVRTPTDEEIRARPEWQEVDRIIEEWILLEYACVYLPAQQNAVVEAVSRGLVIPPEFLKALQLPALPARVMPFTSAQEIERCASRRVGEMNLPAIVEAAVRESLERYWGRV